MNNDDVAAVFCGHCKLSVSGTVEGRLACGDGPGYDDIRVLKLVRCSQCGEGVLVSQIEVGRHPETDELLVTDAETLWPKTRSELSPAVPAKLQRAYAEARTCFDAKAYTAAAVMIRRTLEGVCADQGIAERTLLKGLEKLRDSGRIEGRLLDWAQALRVLGNQGAHFTGETVTREDADDALALAEALLDHMYVLAVRYEEFTRRRAGRSSRARPAHERS